jgi:hypothetical protein
MSAKWAIVLVCVVAYATRRLWYREWLAGRVKPLTRGRLVFLGWGLVFIGLIALITWIGGGWVAWTGDGP